MPNWCTNEVSIDGDAEQLLDFGKVVGLLDESGELKKKPALNFDAICQPDEATAAIQAKYDQEHGEGYLSPELYSWRNNNWGTKWSVGENLSEADFDRRLFVLRFDTAWAPPTGIFEHIVKRWPKLMVRVHFDEPSGDFSGSETYYGDEAA